MSCGRPGIVAIAAGLLVSMSPDAVTAQPDLRARLARAVVGEDFDVQHVQGNVYMVTGAGGNVTVQAGEDGAVTVDAGTLTTADGLLAIVGQLADAPVRYVINTHFHDDHTGGNRVLSQAGRHIAAGLRGGGGLGGAGAAVVAHERTLNLMSAPTGAEPRAPFERWPTDTFFVDYWELFVNGEGIQLFHMPAGHTAGDTIVFFRRSDVVSTGDIFVTDGYPVIDLDAGGSINGVIDGLNQVIVLAIPRLNQEGGTLIIPGHGRLSDEADVVVYRDMVTVIRDRIAALIDQGMSLEEVKAARPTRDYDAKYSLGAPGWTPDRFIEAVYQGVGPQEAP